MVDLLTALLAIVGADEHDLRPGPNNLVPMSCNEIQRLFITLVIRPVHAAAHWRGWSTWRRRHQVRSRTRWPVAAARTRCHPARTLGSWSSGPLSAIAQSAGTTHPRSSA